MKTGAPLSIPKWSSVKDHERLLGHYGEPQSLDRKTEKIRCIQADAAVRTPPSALGNGDMAVFAAVIGRLCVGPV